MSDHIYLDDTEAKAGLILGAIGFVGALYVSISGFGFLNEVIELSSQNHALEQVVEGVELISSLAASAFAAVQSFSIPYRVSAYMERKQYENRKSRELERDKIK